MNEDDAIRTHVATEIGVMRALFERLEKSLWGNGQPGVIQTMTHRLEVLERRWWISIGVLGALQFLTGNGVISLRALMGK